VLCWWGTVFPRVLTYSFDDDDIYQITTLVQWSGDTDTKITGKADMSFQTPRLCIRNLCIIWSQQPMYVLQQVSFMLLSCLIFLGKIHNSLSNLHLSSFLFCLMILHSSLTCSVFAFLNPYLEFSPVNWHVGLPVSTVNGKNKTKN
jgi:hypothetical protein